MAATVIPVGPLRQYVGDRPALEVESGQTIMEILQEFGIPKALVAIVMVNGTYQPKSYRVQDNDLVKLIPLMGGG
jgi:sulfur carrier protein ThiS